MNQAQNGTATDNREQTEKEKTARSVVVADDSSGRDEMETRSGGHRIRWGK